MKSKTWLILASALFLVFAVVVSNCAKETASQEPSENAEGKSDAKLKLTPNLPKTMTSNPGAARLGKPPGQPLEAGAKQADTAYQLKLDAPKTAAQGAESVVRVTVTPNEGWKMNDEFPTRMKVTVPEGVSVAKDSMVLKDAEKFAEKELTFAIKFTPQSSGEKSFAADFRFAVCTDATCDPKREQLAWVVAVP